MLVQLAALVALTIAVSAWIAHPTKPGGDNAGANTGTTAGAGAAVPSGGPAKASPRRTPSRRTEPTTAASRPRTSHTRAAPPINAPHTKTPHTKAPHTKTPHTKTPHTEAAPTKDRSTASTKSAGPSGATKAPPATASTNPLALAAGERKRCAPAASACVDLKRHITWLQSKGRVLFGLVRMMPGIGEHATPTGVFRVVYKDKDHISNIYYDTMPYSIFFATGGIAFHEGSLNRSSHGCVHLSMAHAAHYFQVLQPGNTVAVF